MKLTARGGRDARVPHADAHRENWTVKVMDLTGFDKDQEIKPAISHACGPELKTPGYTVTPRKRGFFKPDSSGVTL